MPQEHQVDHQPRPPPKKRNFSASFPTSNKHSVDISFGQDEDVSGTNFVHWPRNLLPTDCPKARIMTWGYDAVFIQGTAAPANKGNIFPNAKDLFYALKRERHQRRPR
jgi:hypothetical protein